MKVIYIASLSHCGSTMLDMLVSGHPRVVGLGEFHMWIDPIQRGNYQDRRGKAPCSCGQVLCDCPVWSPYLDWMDANGEAPCADHYERMHEIISAEVENPVISDSSKHLSYLERLNEAGVEILVLHLLKDVRSYVTSQKRRYKTGDGQDFQHMKFWYRENRKIQDWLEKMDVPHLTVGYEELCFYPEYLLGAICQAADLPIHPPMAELANSKGHVGIGNPMRFDDQKSRRIFYDHRWLLDGGLQRKLMFRPAIERYNRARVYSNVSSVGEQGQLFAPPRHEEP